MFNTEYILSLGPKYYIHSKLLHTCEGKVKQQQHCCIFYLINNDYLLIRKNILGFAILNWWLYGRLLKDTEPY